MELKIVDGEAIPIRIPLKKPFKIAAGTLTHSNHVLVRLIDNQGRVGWGETTTFLEVYGYDQKSLYHALTDHLIPGVMGLDAGNPPGLPPPNQRLRPPPSRRSADSCVAWRQTTGPCAVNRRG